MEKDQVGLEIRITSIRTAEIIWGGYNYERIDNGSGERKIKILLVES